MKKPEILLSLILFIFVVRGLFLGVVFPWFQQPDEQIHYATIQYRAEPEDKSWPIENEAQQKNNARDISTYHFSEEVTRTAQALRFDEVKFESENTQRFSNDSVGPDEKMVSENTWKRYVDTYPPNASGTTSFYYFVGSYIERALSGQSVFVRMFALRAFSVLLGLLTVACSYLLARKIGFRRRWAVLFSGLVAFQPMFSATAAQINIDIALILSFTLFLFAGVGLLKECSSSKKWGGMIRYAALAVAAAVLGVISKGPGLVLIIALYPLSAYALYKKLAMKPETYLLRLCLVTVGLGIAALLVVPENYIASIAKLGSTSLFSSPVESIGRYLGKTLTEGNLLDMERSYWGNFGWLDTSLPEDIIRIILVIEIVGFLAVLVALLRPRHPLPKHLPERQVLVFLLGLVIALQLAIRFYDWRIFDVSKQLVIGTPGRYFLPTLVAHLLVVLTGWGILLQTRARFDLALRIAFVLMVLLSLYSVFDVILPRYYL